MEKFLWWMYSALDTLWWRAQTVARGKRKLGRERDVPGMDEVETSSILNIVASLYAVLLEIPTMSTSVSGWNQSKFEEPFLDVGADDIRMILLQVVNARAKLHRSAVLKPLRKALSESRRYESAWISREQ